VAVISVVGPEMRGRRPRDIYLLYMIRLAEDKWYSRFTSAAKGYESEMGLLSISVVGYTTKDGRLTIDMWAFKLTSRFILIRFNSHDEIGNIAGVPIRSFEETYPEKSKEFKRVVKEYIETVRSLKSGTGAVANRNGPDSINVCLELGADGYPIAPKLTKEIKVKKHDLEQLYRLYITYHYRKSLLLCC
jgi:hypothetical protein